MTTPPAPTPAPTPVVCAVIEDGKGGVLVAQRPENKPLPLKWEFPGGKVEVGEQPAEALMREIKEELNCSLIVVRALPRFRHDYGTIVVEMMPFICLLDPESPAPHPHAHVAVKWVTPAEFAGLDFAAADLPVIASYAARAK